MKTKPRNPNPKIFNMTTFLTADDLQTTYCIAPSSLAYYINCWLVVLTLWSKTIYSQFDLVDLHHSPILLRTYSSSHFVRQSRRPIWDKARHVTWILTFTPSESTPSGQCWCIYASIGGVRVKASFRLPHYMHYNLWLEPTLFSSRDLFSFPSYRFGRKTVKIRRFSGRRMTI